MHTYWKRVVVAPCMLLAACCASPESCDRSHERSPQSQPAPGGDSGKADPSILTLDRLFTANEFKEEKFGPIVWSKRDSAYFTLEPAGSSKTERDLVRIDPAGGKKTVIVSSKSLIPPGKDRALAVESFAFSTDESKVLIYTNSKKVWRQNTRGDYWVMDLPAQTLRKLGGQAAPSTLMFAKFSPDATCVAFVRQNNLHVQDLATGEIRALTCDGSDTLINGTADWVNEEELSIRDGFRWSPDGQSIAFWQFDASGVGLFHLVNSAEDLYPKIVSFPYPKVGQTNSATRIGIVGLRGGPARWLSLPGDPREHYVPRMEWTRDGKRLVVQRMNRLQNTNRVMLGDPASGKVRVIHTETDAAWLENDNPVKWVGDEGDMLWLSEQSGWRRAYRLAKSGGKPTPITQGDFDVIQVEAIDSKAGFLYYSASPDQPTQRYLHRTPIAGGKPERLTPAHLPGWHSYDISPNAQWAIHTYSTFSDPPRIELIRLPGHQVERVLVDNAALGKKLSSLRLPGREFFRVEIGRGVALDGWRITPPDFDPAKKFPLLFHVYGEPHGQVVRDAWPGARGLWHWMLAQQGCIVACVDNRGTFSPRGRDWRKVVHRQIGILASQEQAAAAAELLKLWPFADPARVGIWGWSGGGSMSLNAVFRHPDLYRTAISVAPVADQLLYDSIYQERYMGLPADNAQGYRDGSPLTHAHRLQGDLLLIHGTGDDNCHYQGTERLANQLIKLGKTFTLMPYPNRSHSISEGEKTPRHFYGLMTRYLQRHLFDPPNRISKADKP